MLRYAMSCCLQIIDFQDFILVSKLLKSQLYSIAVYVFSNFAGLKLSFFFLPSQTLHL